jgi:hypothetical protein
VITSGREQSGRRSDPDDSFARGLGGFESWALVRGAAALALWAPNADRVRAITALIQALPLPTAAESGKGIEVDDWRSWLSSQDSQQLREVVPDGYYDSPPAVEAKIFSTRFGLLTGFLEAADLHLGLWVALITGLEHRSDEYVYSAVRLVMAGAEISNMVIERAELGRCRWPDHSLEGKIGVPSEAEYERLCASVEFTLEDLEENTVGERDLRRLLATAETLAEDRHLKPLVSDGRRYLLASPAELHQATLTQAVGLALRSPMWMTVLGDWLRRAENVLLRIASDMDWVVEAQTGSGMLLRFDTDKLAAVELLLAPVDPLSAPAVRLGAELERARQRLKDHRARDSQVELGLVVYVGDGRSVACPLPEKTESPFGPWLLSLGELRLLGDALRLDPLGLWRLLLRAPPPPWVGGADLVDLLGHIRRLDETPDGMDALSRDGTEYLQQRARFMTGRHPAPSPDPPGWVTVSRWRGTPDVKIFAAEAGFAPFALLARGPGRFCWVVANAPVKDSYDLLAALTQMTAFWAARLLEAGWLAAPPEVAVDVAMRVLVNFDEQPGATLLVAPYRDGARVLAGQGFLHMLCKADNEADRMLVAGLVTSMRPIDDESLRGAVDQVVPAGRGTFMIWPNPEVRRVNVELDPPEIVLECERRQVGHDIAANMLEDTQVASAQDDAAQEILRAINGLVVALLDHELEFSRPEILLDLIRLYERACVHEERLGAALPSRAELPESLRGIPTPRVDLLLTSLTLTRHDDYDPLARDLKPWRANRERSYLRRPLVELADGRLAWGALHTLQTIRYVLHLIETGRLSCSDTLRRAVRDLSQQLDRDFEKDVENECRRLGWETRRNVRKLDRTRLERGRGEDLGDLDVLAWDRVSGRVWVLDAKRISPSIVPIDMRREARSLEGYVEKHLKRLRWLETHPLQLIAEIGPPATGDSWVVKTALVSQFPLVGAHLSSLQLPVWWLDDIRRYLHL